VPRAGGPVEDARNPGTGTRLSETRVHHAFMEVRKRAPAELVACPSLHQVCLLYSRPDNSLSIACRLYHQETAGRWCPRAGGRPPWHAHPTARLTTPRGTFTLRSRPHTHQELDKVGTSVLHYHQVAPLPGTSRLATRKEYSSDG